MNKQEFLDRLAVRLASLSQNEIDKSLSYYAEIIDDHIEEGESEEEAVVSLGSMDDIVQAVMLDMPLPTLMKAKMKPKQKVSGLMILLLVLGFPLWFPLLIAFFSVLFSVYVAIWSLIISLYALVIGLAASGIFGFFFICFHFPLNVLAGIFALGCSLFCIGVGILLFFPIKGLTVYLIRLTVRFGIWVKSLFIKKERE